MDEMTEDEFSSFREEAWANLSRVFGVPLEMVAGPKARPVKKAVPAISKPPRYTPAEAAARYPKGLEKVSLVGGQKITAHSKGSCALYWCAIHYPSPHHMRDWEQLWVSEEQRMYRICSAHTREHPDPDDLIPGNPQDYRCDCTCRCCERPYDINSEI
jgi:hypothetical protein